MLRAGLALLVLASLAAAGLDPASEAAALRRDVNGYLAQAQEETARPWLPGPSGAGTAYGVVAATAGGGVFGWLDARASVWYPRLKGDVSDSVAGNISIDSTLGLDENEVAIVPQVQVNFWVFGVKLDGYHIEFQGDQTITQTITFQGFTFTISDQVATDFQADNLRLLGMVRFWNSDSVRLWAIVGISYYHVDVTLQSTLAGQASETADLPIPVVGFLGQVRMGPLLLEGEVSGLAIDFGSVQGSIVDFQVSAGLAFLKVANVRAGYRYVYLDGSTSDLSVDVTLDGFFLSVGVTF